MSDIDVRIGIKLKKLRESKNLSLNDVGTKVGKARNTIHAYEKGKISISVNVLKSICDAMNYNYIDLLQEIVDDLKDQEK